MGGSATWDTLGKSLAKGTITFELNILSIWEISASLDMYSAIAKNPSYSWDIIFKVSLTSPFIVSSTSQGTGSPYLGGVLVGPNNFVNFTIIFVSTAFYLL